jgi:hypothetical protein
MNKLLTIAIAVGALSFNAFAEHTPEHKATDTKAAVQTKATDAKTAADAKSAEIKADVKATVEKKADKATAGMPTPEQMAEAMKLGQPSDAHKKLSAFEGKWNYTGKFWMDPKGKPETMKGTSENTWILGGRYLQAKATGEATKDWPAFEGMGFTGYDNVKQTYTSSWMDNMSTGAMTATASFNDKNKTLNEEGTYFCPMEKGEKKYRSMWKVKGKDAYQYVSYMTDHTGKEYKAMEIEYKRAK